MSMSLNQILSPKTIAVVGASDDILKPGGRVIGYMLRYGYAGTIYPVSRGKDRVQGIPAYGSLEELPQAPDLVVIALPEALIADTLESAIRAGASAAIIFASGYAELGEAGRAEQRRITEIAHRGGLRLIGPNTQGLANFATGAIAHFGTIIDQIAPVPSPIGIVSQSGAGSQIIYSRLNDLGLGARYLVATGNEADLDIADIIEAYAHDPDLKLILVYAESIKSPDKLARAAILANARNLPILMVKAGRTQSGQQTAASHTGALASEDRLVDAFLEKYGIVRAADFEELAQLSPLFLAQRGQRGRRLVSISNSGATCVLSADAAEENGLELSVFEDSFKARLSDVLPPYIAPGNPIDMTTATLKNPQLFEQILERIEQADAADMVFAGFPIGGKGYDFDRFARELRAFSDTSQRPVAVSVNQDWAAAVFRGHQIPVFSSERRAIAALAALANYHERHALAASAPLQHPAHLVTGTHQRMRNELDSMTLLADAGLPVVHHAMYRTADEVVAAWRAQHPMKVVLKGVSDTLGHKSEHGLVHVGLASETALREAAHAILDRLTAAGETDPRLLMADMVPADFELMAGAHFDPEFGPMVALGHGGVLVEALDDIQFMTAPLTIEEATRRINRLQIARAFKATRGLPAVDLQPLAELLVRLGNLLVNNPHNITSLDINPIRVRRGPHAPVIVDALIIQSTPGESP